MPGTNTEKETARVSEIQDSIAGIVGNRLWVLADSIPADETLQIQETQELLAVEWGTEQSVFLQKFLQGYNLLKNPEFCHDKEKSLKAWRVDAEKPEMVGVDFSPEWHINLGHTAFLTALEDAPRPSIETEQRIPIIKGQEYLFSGLFATHRTNGIISIEYYDDQENKVDQQNIQIYNKPEFGGGTLLDNYELIKTSFLPSVKAVYMRIKIALGEQVETSESVVFLFCTQLNLGLDTGGSLSYSPYSSELEKLIDQLQQKKWSYFTTARIPRLYNSKQLSIQLGEKLLQLQLSGQSLLNSLLPSGTEAQKIFKDPSCGVLSVDKSILIGSTGILLYGWQYFIEGKVKALYLHNDQGELIDISDSFFKLSRRDLLDTLKPTFPELTENVGFISYIPVKVNNADKWFIEIELTTDDSKWLTISCAENQHSGVTLIKELLAWDLGADRVHPTLYKLFDQHLGKAIDVISAERRSFNLEVYQQQFGIAPDNPEISVIIPLYGRYDFIRHQLAHFADDPDFQKVDLIYVIDDPSIIHEANELAISYSPVFKVPFRTVWYEGNRGFSGANNIAVSVARGDTLLLMNSDVLPKSKGWVSILHKALNTIPKAGAVGPLLQFADDSVQHAGMQSKRDARLPGFIFNAHPGKGQPWQGGDETIDCDMLSAACIMLNKHEYLELGGMDEGYLIGDFEDSDLCLGLRKQNKKLYLVPEAKLWHLERQSQNLAEISNFRQMLTLYNGWRFSKKIKQGLIADPEQINGVTS